MTVFLVYIGGVILTALVLIVIVFRMRLEDESLWLDKEESDER